MSIVTTLIPDDAELFAVAHEAIAQGFQIIFNGDRFALSRIVPPGWTSLPVGFKQPAHLTTRSPA